MSSVDKRYDFVMFFDVKDGNPNGDPDAGNLPRIDAETGMGLVTDVCLKRKVRNFVQITAGQKGGYDIFVKERGILNDLIEKAYIDLQMNLESEPKNEKDGKKRIEKGKAQGSEIDTGRGKMCKDYYDIRTFGAVLSTGGKGEGAGTIRGPVQFAFSRSEDRIYQAEHSITRCAVTTEEEAKAQETREHASTFGRKATIPYALYRMHGFVSAVDAVKTGFSEDDLNLLWEALLNAFEHDRAAARGEMNPRKLIVFKHGGDAPHLGCARSGELFEKVSITKKSELPRDFKDYEVSIDKNLPKGIELIEKL